MVTINYTHDRSHAAFILLNREARLQLKRGEHVHVLDRDGVWCLHPGPCAAVRAMKPRRPEWLN